MSKKNPKIENISPASSLGSNSPKYTKEKIISDNKRQFLVLK